jgi:hypothetical protein
VAASEILVVARPEVDTAPLLFMAGTGVFSERIRSVLDPVFGLHSVARRT